MLLQMALFHSFLWLSSIKRVTSLTFKTKSRVKKLNKTKYQETEKRKSTYAAACPGLRNFSYREAVFLCQLYFLQGVDPWSFHPHRPGGELAEFISFPCLVNKHRYHRVFWPEAPPSTVCTWTGVFRNSNKAKIQPHRPRHHRAVPLCL